MKLKRTQEVSRAEITPTKRFKSDRFSFTSLEEI